VKIIARPRGLSPDVFKINTTHSPPELTVAKRMSETMDLEAF